AISKGCARFDPCRAHHQIKGLVLTPRVGAPAGKQRVSARQQVLPACIGFNSPTGTGRKSGRSPSQTWPRGSEKKTAPPRCQIVPLVFVSSLRACPFNSGLT